MRKTSSSKTFKSWLVSRIFHYKSNKYADIVAVIIVGLFVVGGFLIATHSEVFDRATDYDVHLALYSYISSYIRSYLWIPMINPYAGAGISVLGDPLSSIYNPILVFSIVFFGAETGLRLYYLSTVLLSGVSMVEFAKALGISQGSRIWGAVLYMTSGALSARYAAGHVESWFSFVLYPFLLRYIILPSLVLKQRVCLALILSLSVLSGHAYGFYFMSILYLCSRCIVLMQKKAALPVIIKDVLLVYGFTTLFISPKVYFFFHEVWEYAVRFHPTDPFLGSLHIPFIPMTFVIPFGYVFYDRVLIQSIFGFSYNWYEYFAFISPLAFVFFWYTRHAQRRYDVRLIVLLLIISWLYVASAFVYSPFHWLLQAVPILQIFRVPQRMIMIMTPVVIALCALGRDEMMSVFRKPHVVHTLSILTLVWTTSVFITTARHAYSDANLTNERDIVQALSHLDDVKESYVSVFSCCMQTYLVEAEIPNLHFYYGWKDSRIKEIFSIRDDGREFRPRYIIAPGEMSFAGRQYRLIYNNETLALWQTDDETISPSYFDD